MPKELPANTMICIPCRQCNRDQFVVTNADGQPHVYDGAGMSANGASLEESFRHLLEEDCNDCERIKALDAAFIKARYAETLLERRAFTSSDAVC